MLITPNFTLQEFTASDTAARLGIDNAPDQGHLANIIRTAQLMERVRAGLGGHPIHVSSGYRSPALNKAVGGVPNSAHALGYAADWECPGYGDPLSCALALKAANLGGWEFDQMIHERKVGSWWVHLSSDPQNRRQLLTLTHANPDSYAAGIFMPAPWSHQP